MTEAYGIDIFKPEAELLREESAQPTIVVEPQEFTLPPGLRSVTKDDDPEPPQD